MHEFPKVCLHLAGKMCDVLKWQYAIEQLHGEEPFGTLPPVDEKVAEVSVPVVTDCVTVP